MAQDYPIYRKYAHGRTFFKIESDERFQELQLMAKNYSLTDFRAKILPDYQRIVDMIDNSSGHWEPSDQGEWDAQLKRAEAELTKGLHVGNSHFL